MTMWYNYINSERKTGNVNMKLPGTSIEVEKLNREYAAVMLDGIFAAGGLVLSQIATLTGVELYSVQNWVKRGFVSPPKAKKYTKRQFCRLVIINMLRDAMPIVDLTEMLSYINGDLADESDDTVSDDTLYLYFISMLATVESSDEETVEAAARKVTEEYVEPAEHTRERLCRVLRIMYFAYRATLFSRSAAKIMTECKNELNSGKIPENK